MSKITVKSLKLQLKNYGVKGYSKMKKAELLNAVKKYKEDEDYVAPPTKTKEIKETLLKDKTDRNEKEQTEKEKKEEKRIQKIILKANKTPFKKNLSKKKKFELVVDAVKSLPFNSKAQQKNSIIILNYLMKNWDMSFKDINDVREFINQ